ncbi:hypothetical protein M3Y99_00512500 [Aphelenchoides fujianensis]|nr:hypothetical protein M3Y99_00512500 [Aphelenchoides fujianensis]
MMKAECVWSGRNTTSFRWTHNAISPPAAAHKELSRATADGYGEIRRSPLFPVATSGGVLACLQTSVEFDGDDANKLYVIVEPKGELHWRNFQTAVWIEASNGKLLGEKTFVHENRMFVLPMSEVRAFLSTAPFTVCCVFRPYTNAVDLDDPAVRQPQIVPQPLIGAVPEQATARFKLLVPGLGLAKKCVNWESNEIQAGEGSHKFKTIVNLEQLPGEQFRIEVQILSEGRADEETFWHVRSWLENGLREKSYVREDVEKFFDASKRIVYVWRGSAASHRRFATSDVLFCFEFTRFVQQPAIVERQPEIVQPVAVEQNGGDGQQNAANKLDFSSIDKILG